MTLKVKLMSPHSLVCEVQSSHLHVPGAYGFLGIGSGHAPFVSDLSFGPVSFQPLSGEKVDFFITGGVLSVEENEILILASSVCARKELNQERAKRSLERANQRLNNFAKDVDIERALRSKARAVSRLSLSAS